MSDMSPALIALSLWGLITAVFVVLVIYRSLLSMHEEDRIFLDPVEARQEAEQREIITRVQRITPYTKGLGIASAGLLVLSGALYLYQAWKS